jgi:hypothetical protein
MVSDELIDRLLFSYFGLGRSVKDILDTLKVPSDNSEEVYEALLGTKCFEPGSVSHGDDYLMLTKFGRSVKDQGGWIRYIKKLQSQEERERLEMSQLRVNIFKVKYWWWILIFSSILSALVSVGLPVLLKRFGIDF